MKLTVPIRSWHLLMLSLFFLPGTSFIVKAQGPIPQNFPRHDWQPTRAQPGWRYLGNQVCSTCHVAEAATQPSTPMGVALELASDCQILLSHPSLRVTLGGYTYKITSVSGHATYVVSGRHGAISAELVYALGHGDAGQTYLFRYKGAYYESQVSYFNQIQGLDMTLGHSPVPTANLEAALGVRLSEEDAVRCFACHSTAAVRNRALQLDRMMPGLTCEGCHGPGAEHVAAVKAGRLADLHIFNPGRLRDGDLNDFCGSCHRTASDVAALNVAGAKTVRFQSYRLFLSRCFLMSNESLSCVTCHNPHQPLEPNEAFYDSKCLACHSLTKNSASRAHQDAVRCPVGRRNCATCHMPKVALPGGHYKFADHDIRIVRPGEPFPG